MNILKSARNRYETRVREKAIKRSETRILLAGRKVEDFDPQDLEIIVCEEEEKLKAEAKEKGVLVVLAVLGLSWFG
jgi:lysyl-tRNA synthetase class I